MRGQILNFDAAAGAGFISGDDGVRYSFRREALRQQVTPWSGAAVDFVPQGADATDVFVLNNAAAHSYSGVASPEANWSNVFFSVDGRIPRSRFWAAWGIMIAVGVFGGAIPFIGFVVQFGLIWANICVYGKRLHDMGRSAWWLLPFMFFGMLSWIAAFAFLGFTLAGMDARQSNLPIDSDTGLALLAGAAGFWIILYWGFTIWVGATPSEPRENRFGPAPGQSLATTFD